MALRRARAYLSGMQTWLTYALYGVIALLVVTLAAGVINLVRTDAKALSRSNQLMRLRVAVQFVAVILIVGIAALAGKLNW